VVPYLGTVILPTNINHDHRTCCRRRYAAQFLPERLGGSRGVPDRLLSTSHHANQGSYRSPSSVSDPHATKLVIIYPGCGDFCGGTFCKVVPLNLLHAAMSTHKTQTQALDSDGRTDEYPNPKYGNQQLVMAPRPTAVGSGHFFFAESAGAV